jgi:hypothetical protein
VRRRRQGLARLGLLAALILLVVVLAVAFIDCGGSGGGGQSSPSATPSTNPSATPTALFTPTAQRPLRLKNYGDSMGGELGMALAPVVQRLSVVKYRAYYKVSSSLVKPSFFDWQAYLASDLPRLHPDAVVWMVGTNDGQGMVAGGQVLAFGTPQWRSEYARRVAAVLATFKRAGVRRVYWVGMPVMRSAAFSTVMKTVNTVARAEVARHAGVTYVDAWKLLSTSSGAYDPRWRQSDGIHFNIDGQNRLAAAVMQAIRQDWHIK